MKRQRRKLTTLTIEQMHDWNAAISAEIEARSDVDVSQLSRALAFIAGDRSLERSAAELRMYAEQMTGWLIADMAGVVKREPRACVDAMRFERLAGVIGVQGGAA